MNSIISRCVIVESEVIMEKKQINKVSKNERKMKGEKISKINEGKKKEEGDTHTQKKKKMENTKSRNRSILLHLNFKYKPHVELRV